MDEEKDALETQDTPGEGQEKANDAEAQKLRSWLGRVEKEGKVTKALLQQINDRLETLGQARVAPQESEKGKDPVNDALYEQMYSGDFMGALDKWHTIKAQGMAQLQRVQEKQLLSALEGMADKPMFGDISGEVVEKAKKMVADGARPTDAARMAYNETVNEHLLNTITNGGANTAALSMLGTGSKKGKERAPAALPEKFEKACQRDIQAGLFKDKGEWIAALSPKIRAELGV